MNNNNAFNGIKFESEDINYEAAEAAVVNLGSLMGGQGQQGECVSWQLTPVFICVINKLGYNCILNILFFCACI